MKLHHEHQCIWASWGPPGGCLWSNLELLKDQLDHLEAVLGCLGSLLGRLGCILGLSWAVLEPSWLSLRRLEDILEAILGISEASWDDFGRDIDWELHFPGG
eukprot:1557357-Pyramimonas_sp.AAC.1